MDSEVIWIFFHYAFNSGRQILNIVAIINFFCQEIVMDFFFFLKRQNND